MIHVNHYTTDHHKNILRSLLVSSRMLVWYHQTFAYVFPSTTVIPFMKSYVLICVVWIHQLQIKMEVSRMASDTDIYWQRMNRTVDSIMHWEFFNKTYISEAVGKLLQ